MPKASAPCYCGCGYPTRRANGYVAGHYIPEEVLTSTQIGMLTLVHLNGYMTSDNGTYNLNTARALAQRGKIRLVERAWGDSPNAHRWVAYPK